MLQMCLKYLFTSAAYITLLRFCYYSIFMCNLACLTLFYINTVWFILLWTKSLWFLDKISSLKTGKLSWTSYWLNNELIHRVIIRRLICPKNNPSALDVVVPTNGIQILNTCPHLVNLFTLLIPQQDRFNVLTPGTAGVSSRAPGGTPNLILYAHFQVITLNLKRHAMVEDLGEKWADCWCQ